MGHPRFQSFFRIDMQLNEFRLERYFGKHEFSAKYLLSSSDCDGFAMQDVLDVASSAELKLWEGLTLGYTESPGHPLLREAILQHYQSNDVAEVVVASPGELNYITMQVLLQKGDHVVAVSPAYQSLHEIVKSIGCELNCWKPDPQSWKFDLNELQVLLRPDTRMIILNFPHNPTGSYLSQTELETIVVWARERGCYVFSDEMYRGLVAEGVELLAPVSDLYEKGISLWGTSKSFGLAGLRTGWLVCQDKDFLQKVVAYKDYLSICNSAPAEILSLIAVNHMDRFLHENQAKIRQNTLLFEEFSQSQPIVARFVRPNAGSTTFVELNIEGTALAFCDDLVKKHGIMVVPGEMFDWPGKYIRIGFGRRNFPEVLARLAAALKA